MSKETHTELQARIAALAGQINRHKQQPISQHPPRHGHHAGHIDQQYGRGATRWTPYSHGARAAFPRTVKNHTPVSGDVKHPIVLDEDDTSMQALHGTALIPANFVSSRVGNNAQLMTKDTYKREQRRQQEYQQRRITNPVYPPPRQPTRPTYETLSTVHTARVLEFDGIRFELQADGSKLVRLSGERCARSYASAPLKDVDPATADKETPRRVKIADVEFLRTKSGNLIRAATTTHGQTRYHEELHIHAHKRRLQMSCSRLDGRASSKQCDKFTKYGTISIHYHDTSPRGGHRHRSIAPGTSVRHALMLTYHTGICPHGPSCSERHDPNRIAICKEFFATGFCQAGRSCDLSHEPNYHRVPACIHFLRGNCTKSACRYAHVDVSASTLVCRPFATLGYCSRGVKCGNRHVFECPDYTNLGHCEAREKRACPLPHIDHANTLRKAAKRQGKQSSEDGSDVSSDEEEQATAVETDDDSDIEITMGTDDSHQLTQQQDYVGFT